MTRLTMTHWLLLIALISGFTIAGFATVGPTAGTALAQEQDEEFDDEDRDEEEDDEDEDEDDDEGDDEEWDEDDEREELRGHMIEIEMFGQMLETVATYGKIAKDPDLAGVAAVLSVEDHIDDDIDGGIAFLTGALKDTKSDAVRRAIHMKLVDAYSAKDDHKKALEHLRKVITDDIK
jgi:hypothetical protein